MNQNPNDGSREASSPSQYDTEECRTLIAPLLAEDEDSFNLSVAFENVTIDDGPIDLESFRDQWKRELEQKKKHEDTVGAEQTLPNQSVEKAKNFFLEGIECEKKGDMSEAVRLYNKAVKLVPDIEQQMFPRSSTTSKGGNTNTSTISEDKVNLMEVFHNRIYDRGHHFLVDNTANACYFQCLPRELLCMILRFVVGSQLDIRSLLALSESCCYLYVLARENELWRLIMKKSVGEQVVIEKKNEHPDLLWKERLLSTPHLHFFGVYASKCTYIRHGESSFQDDKFRPWFTISYYRLIRFFANGGVIMTTTSEAPLTAAQSMKTIDMEKADNSTLCGEWWYEDGCVCANVRRKCKLPRSKVIRKKHLRELEVQYGISCTEFSFKLSFISRRENKWGLIWKKNISTTTYFDGSQSVTDMESEKDTQAFPPLRFFRVKSFIFENDDELE